MHPQPAAGEIHEDQLLNFIVNQLTVGFELNLGANADLTPRDFWQAVVGACIDGTAVSTLCASSQATYSANVILYHLRTKVDLETLDSVGTMLLQRNTIDRLPDEAEFVVDLHLRPYYGDEAETDGLYHAEAKVGTTAFHDYATLYARVRNKRYTVAIRRVTNGERPVRCSPSFSPSLRSWKQRSERSTSTGSSTIAAVWRSSNATTLPP
jgi:hypothetical protein